MFAVSLFCVHWPNFSLYHSGVRTQLHTQLICGDCKYSLPTTHTYNPYLTPKHIKQQHKKKTQQDDRTMVSWLNEWICVF